MLAVSALRLNDDCRNVLFFCMNDGTMRQADVDMNCSDLACVPEIENGSSIFHVLLDCGATSQTWCLRQCSMSILFQSGSSIRSPWQTRWTYLTMLRTAEP
jgi:hypothetical protein